MIANHVLAALANDSYHAARMVARDLSPTVDGHHLSALGRGDEWASGRLIEEIEEALRHAGEREQPALRGLSGWAAKNQTIIALWSSHGHRFLGDGTDETCLTCGARYELVHDSTSDIAHGRYRTNNGDDPVECSGDTSMTHGEGYCEECKGEGCTHCRHLCNCLVCTG